MTKFKKVFFVFVFAMLLANAVNATTGCIYSSGYIYYSQHGNYGGYPNYDYSPRIMDSSVYCVVESSSYCRIDGSDGVWGNIVTFSMVDNCPIDDYICWLLLPIAGLGFIQIKKRIWLSA